MHHITSFIYKLIYFVCIIHFQTCLLQISFYTQWGRKHFAVDAQGNFHDKLFLFAVTQRAGHSTEILDTYDMTSIDRWMHEAVVYY